VQIGRRHLPLNAVFMNGPNWGKDVFIPMDYIIGGVGYVGQGWKMLMNCLAAGRSISLPANGTGIAKLCALTTGAYGRVRTQFKMPVGRFEGVEEAIARIGGHAYLMEAARVMTAGAVDLGEKPSVVSAIVKYHLTELGRQVMNDAMDVHGGKGICMGPNNYLARAYQSIPIAITVEGANILTRSMIIFGQGAIRGHPYVLKEIAATREKDAAKALVDFDAGILRPCGVRPVQLCAHAVARLHARHFRSARRATRTPALLPATDAAIERVRPDVRRRHVRARRLAQAPRAAVGAARRYPELALLASCVLKRYEDSGRPADDLPCCIGPCRTRCTRSSWRSSGSSTICRTGLPRSSCGT